MSISLTVTLFLGLHLGIGCPIFIGLFGSILFFDVDPDVVLAGIGTNCTCFFGVLAVVEGDAVVFTAPVVVAAVACARLMLFQTSFETF